MEREPLTFSKIEQKETEKKELSFEEWKELKKKEAKGEINEKELQEAFSFEFNSFKKSKNPFSGEFSPEEEIREIRRLPREEKRKNLTSFKEKLNSQREAWANCRLFLERMIFCNPDTSKKDMMKWIEEFGDNYGFTKEQLKKAEEIIDKYHKERQSILDLQEKYPQKEELLKKITGADFENYSDIEVVPGPAWIDIRTNSEGVEAIKKANNISFNENEESRLEGFSFWSATNPSVRYNVINKESSEAPKTELHEKEHIKNKILGPLFESSLQESEDLAEIAGTEKNPETRKALFMEYYRRKREKYLNWVKDEIIAHKKAGNPIDAEMFFDQYHYFKDILEKITTKEETEAKEKVLVEEYRNIIEEAIFAFEKMEEAGYTKDEIIAIFMDKTIKNWPKIQ